MWWVNDICQRIRWKCISNICSINRSPALFETSCALWHDQECRTTFCSCSGIQKTFNFKIRLFHVHMLPRRSANNLSNFCTAESPDSWNLLYICDIRKVFNPSHSFSVHSSHLTLWSSPAHWPTKWRKTNFVKLHKKCSSLMDRGENFYQTFLNSQFPYWNHQ